MKYYVDGEEFENVKAVVIRAFRLGYTRVNHFLQGKTIIDANGKKIGMKRFKDTQAQMCCYLMWR
jgi:hypothetical protein